MDPSIQQPIHDAVQQGLDSLPLSTHSLVLAAFIAGAVMWLFGRHILRMTFVLIGMAAGGLAASLLLPALQIGVPPVVGIIIGAALGGVLSFVVFRVTVALWLGALGAILGVSICALVIGFSMPEPPTGPLLGDELLLEGVPLVDSTPAETDENSGFDGPPLELPDAATLADERIRAFVDHLVQEARTAWSSIPSDQRLKLVSSALLGLSLGAIIGFIAPKRSSAALTACVGSAVIIGSGLWLASAAGLEPPRIPLAVWAMVWIVLSALGMKVQLMGSRRKADND